MRVALIALAALALAGCSETGRAWYESGDASYDAVKRATEACKAQGGAYQLKKGGDPTNLGDFSCVGAKGH